MIREYIGRGPKKTRYKSESIIRSGCKIKQKWKKSEEKKKRKFDKNSKNIKL